MGFKTQAFATIWEVNSISDTMTKVRLSTSKKSKTTGNWETDFSGYVCFVGAANAKEAAHLNVKDRIKLHDIEVTTAYSKEKNTNYTNFYCYGFEFPDGSGNTSNSSEPTTARAEAIAEQVEDVISDGQIPF